MSKCEVKQIPAEQVKEWLLKRHYAHRMPSISYAFALTDGNEAIGICTFVGNLIHELLHIFELDWTEEQVEALTQQILTRML